MAPCENEHERLLHLCRGGCQSERAGLHDSRPPSADSTCGCLGAPEGPSRPRAGSSLVEYGIGFLIRRSRIRSLGTGPCRRDSRRFNARLHRKLREPTRTAWRDWAIVMRRSGSRWSPKIAPDGTIDQASHDTKRDGAFLPRSQRRDRGAPLGRRSHRAPLAVTSKRED